MKTAFNFLFLILAFNCYSQENQKPNELNSFWKIGYPNLPFWDSTFSYIGERGYIDTFSVKENKFRIIHNDSMYDGIVEMYKNKKWIKNVVFDNLGNNNAYNRTQDVNLDGFKDIIWLRKWDTEVFLYNPKLQRFTNTSFTHPEKWILIDKNKKVFCDFWEHWYAAENHTKLYTFQGLKLISLYRLEYITNERTEQLIKKVILYKTTNSGVDLKIKEINVDSDEFDYLNFWTSNYKQLLNGIFR
jgi:hypothetical protein